MNGLKLTFSEADLQAIATAYDPAVHEAPLTVGHPKGSAPAYGWARKLEADGAVLYVQADQLDPGFVDLVNAGRYKKRSAAFYLPTSPSNPKPGSYYLQHVAFLGAQAPAVKGLRDVQFAEQDDQVVVFGDWTTATMARLVRGMRDWLIGKFGQEEADKALPGWDVQALADEAIRETTRETNPHPQAVAGLSYEEGSTTMTTATATPAADLAAREAALAHGQQQLAADTAALAARQAATAHAARTAAFSEFADGLVRAGQLLPKDKLGLVSVLGALPEATVLEFGEGDGLVKKPAADVLQDFLKGLPKVVHFGEHAGAKGAVVADVDTKDGVAIAKAAVEFQEAQHKAGRTVSLEQAVQHIVTTHKED